MHCKQSIEGMHDDGEKASELEDVFKDESHLRRCIYYQFLHAGFI